MPFPLSMSYAEDSPKVTLNSITTIPNETLQGNSLYFFKNKQAYFLFTGSQTLENALLIEF